ncbi:class I SAM-dependent methyltransferase [Synechococcus sp. RSCCF101]|uniref:class I SAM-dependent methyltransferase n=1 Tax=Synechococcus sp. RSCCF101 TaxID=2511069 RepID=UPI00124914CB|nr:class I SAM-dependent methyltransferase [Synechococcus sp. RSCCF101]QEY33121.1 class I SAM-dependent methyltransferase [Synechococcus sp. RSCCF101]
MTAATPSPASDAATPVVSAFYDRFPYPGDPMQDGPPPGYNWRWCHRCVVSACIGVLPASDPSPLRILDAGCGTGVSTDYLAHLNPGAEILAVDISGGALDLARTRLQRSGGDQRVLLRQEQRSLLDLAGEGPFHLINSVGVLHHLRDPLAGLRALADLLAPDGVMHLFLYAAAGRWEIRRTQAALASLGLQPDGEGVGLARRLLADLPEANALRRSHEERWAIDTAAESNFADMYLHPQEAVYDLNGLFDLIEAAGLSFAGFSNPEVWDPARLLQGELLERALALPERRRWQLVELLDPAISHLEFFVSREPLVRRDPSEDHALLSLTGERSPCLWGYPSQQLLGRDMQPIHLTEAALSLLDALERAAPGTPFHALPLAMGPDERSRLIRDLVREQVLMLRDVSQVAPEGA